MTTALSHGNALGPGSVIAGKYRVVRVIGEGGMGVVYEAEHLRLRQRVAVKMLLSEMLPHQTIVSRFEREARAAGQLRSPHVARVMDVDVTDTGFPYLVMELLDGHDLAAELAQRVRLPHEEAVDYVLQACAAMVEAHQLGIVHRDLKPANLFLARGDRARIVKVLDFGISKSEAEVTALTAADTVVGTAFYMSPEQLLATDSVDARSDIWALGVILYELTSGRPPWTGTATQVAASIVTEDPPDILTLVELPLELVAIISKCLRREQSLRFGTIRELALALGEFSAKGGVGRMFADELLLNEVTIGGSTGVPLTAIAGRGPATQNDGSPSNAPAARAPSENRFRSGGSTDTKRTSLSSLIVPMLLAFGVGVVVLGGGAFAWLKLTAAPRPSSAPVVVETLAAESASSPPEPSVVATVEPAPPVAPPTATTKSHDHSRRPLRTPQAAPPPASPGSPASSAEALPLHL